LALSHVANRKYQSKVILYGSEKMTNNVIKLDSVHFSCNKIILQQYEKAKDKIGECTCRCGKEADNDTTVVFTVFKTAECWEPRRIEDGFTEEENLITAYICRASVYCKACADIYEVFSDLDYEDQMEIIIAKLEKSGVKMNIPCRPKSVEDKNRLVTYFINFIDYGPIDNEDEYYQACDEAEKDYNPTVAEKKDDKARGWMKAKRKFHEANQRLASNPR
jgi:hypothetical protein